jgi:hypothetical protein
MLYLKQFLKVIAILLLAIGVSSGNEVSAADEDHPDPIINSGD